MSDPYLPKTKKPRHAKATGFGSGRSRAAAFLSSLLVLIPLSGEARNVINGNGPAGAHAASSQAASAATSQTATAATAATAQAVQAAATARHAQDSFVKAAATFQSTRISQAQAHAAALAATSTVPDGLGDGGLVPFGGVPSTSNGSAIQIIQLGAGGKGQLSLGSSGSVTLPSGTPGTDQIAVTGAGSVTSVGGTVTSTAGSVMTTTGGTLATTSGGTISLTAGNGTLTATTNTTITSTLPGTVTLPGGGTVTLAANQSSLILAGSKVSFSGTSAGTVSVTGPGTVALAGAGTLALANATAAAAGGTITTNSGTTTFSNGGTVSALPAGSKINLVGSGTINLTGTTDGSSVSVLPVIVPSSSSSSSIFNFTTTGTVLSTLGYNLPSSWTGVGALSESRGAGGSVTDTITQTSAEALLYWSSFNIGKSTTLDFDQSAGGANAGSWVAINQIVNDPSLAPSQILGAIQAPGQVYVINQNGIIFGGSSQVNTHALVASSLPINTNLITPENLLGGSSTQDQFLFSQLTVPVLAGVANALPAFNPGNVVSVAASSAGSNQVTLASSILPAGFGVGSILLGSTVQSIDGKTVTLASGANAALANTSAAYSLNDGSYSIQVLSASTGRGATRVTLASSTLPPGFGVGSQLLGATVQSINGATVTLSAAANAVVSNSAQAYTNFNGNIRTDGDVVVEKGAQLTSPTTAEHVGGKIALIGPIVKNDGIISTHDGQTILAAGLQVGFTPHDQTDPTLRGLNVFVGGVPSGSDADGNANGTVINNGIIDSERADITLTGKNIDQEGTIASVTSVALNGRIDLLADYGAVQSLNGAKQPIIAPSLTGTVTLGANSITEILPDTTGATVVGSSLALPSIVNIEAGTIKLLGSSTTGAGAQLLAPGARAVASDNTSSSPTDGTVDLTGQALTSGVNLTAGDWISLQGGSTPVLTATTGQIDIMPGANIDVAGSQDVAASVTENIVAAQLRGTELADSPLQQNGALRGQTVDIDIRQSGVYNGVAWIGSPIGDLSGYAGLVQHTVNELTVNGGTVGIQAGTGVNIEAGAIINVSGGYINYQGGMISTSKVVTAGGQLLDISQATPDQLYQGLEKGFTVNSPKWGVTQTFGDSSPAYYDPGYIQGGNGGALTISTPSLAMQGNLYGNTVAGTRQQSPTQKVQITELGTTGGAVTESVLGLSQFAKASFTTSSSTPSANFMTQLLVPIDAAPSTSTLILNLFPQLVIAGQPPSSPIAPEDVVFQAPNHGSIVPNPVSSSGNQVLYLSSDLVTIDGFGNLAIEGNPPAAADFNATSPLIPVSTAGNITLPAGVALTTSEGGSITLASVDIDLEGSISSPGGSLTFSTQNLLNSNGAMSPIQALPGRGDFILGSTASLSTAGLIVNNSATSSLANTLPQKIAGGTVTIQSLNADLMTGSAIDASGGVLINAKGAVTYGPAGSIDIEAGRDTAAGSGLGIIGGSFYLGSTLTAYSGASGGGGSLTIVAPAIQVGGAALENGDTSGALVQESNLVSGNGTSLLLDGNFFSQGGFSTFAMSGFGLAPITYAGEVATQVDPYASTPGVLIAPGTTIAPEVQSYQQVVDGSGVDLVPTTYALASQRNPVNLTFNATGVSATTFQPQVLLVRGDLVMGAGASIITDPSGSVTLKGQTATVLGQVYAPGGTITVQGASDSKNLFSSNAEGDYTAADIAPTVDLGKGSSLSTKGIAEATFNAFGYDTGTVLNGGTITVSGNIVAEQGSVLDVSGNSGVFDVSPSLAGVTINSTNSRQLVPIQETSNGGSINFKGQEELFVDSTLLGSSGGNGAQAGSLSISNGFSNYNVTNPTTVAVQTQLDATLVVSQTGLTRDPTLTGEAVIGSQITPLNPLLDVDGDAILGYFSANTNIFSSTVVSPPTLDSAGNAVPNNGGMAGGLGSLTLSGTVQFAGRVSINTANRLFVGTNSALSPLTPKANIVAGGIIYANDLVTLSSGYVQLGLPFAGPLGSVPTLPATTGLGSLTVTASTLIDVGILQLQGIKQLSLSTPGDVRGDGSLDVAGNISINAGQIYPTTETTFTIAALEAGGNSSRVTISRPDGSLPSLPLSAGGVLNIYADTIVQNGVLRAPMGTINLGTLAPPAGLPTTGSLILGSNSVTSVSAVDPNTGSGITIPYGQIDNNGNWIDPAGNTITAGSTPTLPAKAVNISGAVVMSDPGSTIDVRGGGDLLASQFVSGTGGLNDILGSASSFAILPSSNQAAYAAFATDSGFSTSAYSNLQIGDQIYLSGGNGLAAGTYTLLPSRYALLPGAFLVTPKSGTTNGSAVTKLDGSTLVSGYRTSSLNGAREQSVNSLFEVDSQSVINARAQYSTSSANSYFPKSAASLGVASPRLPVDAGQVVFQAGQSLSIPNSAGTLLGQAGLGGLGSIVDISSSGTTAINIYNSIDATNIPVAGDLNLDSSALNAFGADSLLIGGFRTVTSTGTQVTVTTGSLTVNNSGAPLIGPDVILVSNGSLFIDANSAVESTPGSTVNAPLLRLSGDNTVVRVSSDANAQIDRTGVTANTAGPSLKIGAGAIIGSAPSLAGAGQGSVILDSTSASSLDAQAILSASSVSLNSGQITLVLPDLASPLSAGLQGLVISSATLADLQATTQNLSLLSYSSLDIAGSGNIGAPADASGNFQVKSLALHASEIRGFDNAGNAVTINAQNVMLDDVANGFSPGPMVGSTLQGTLTINAASISLGVNPLAIDQFASVTLAASKDVVLGNGTGSLSVAGNLILSTPLLTSAPLIPLTPLQELNGIAAPKATVQTIRAGGALTLSNPGGSVTPLAEGLGSNVTLVGTSVAVDNNIQLPSGSLAIVATSGDLNVGGNLDVGGSTEAIYSLTQTTPGGQISLSSYTGNVNLGSGSSVNVSSSGGSLVSVASSNTDTNTVLIGSNLPSNFVVGTQLLGSTVQSITPLQLSVVASSTGSPTVTLSSATLPAGFGVGSSFLGSTIQSINGNVVTLAANANSSISTTTLVSLPLEEVTLAGNANATLSNGYSGFSAPTNGGNAGSLSISAPAGTFSFAGSTLLGEGGLSGQGGTFSLDAESLEGTSLAPLQGVLNPVVSGSTVGDTYRGGFTDEQTIRIRTHDVIVDGISAAQAFNLSTDSGSVKVTGTGKVIANSGQTNASGVSSATVDVSTSSTSGLLLNSGETGGSISITASDSVILQPGSLLSVAAQTVSDAGKGGTITLEAGAEINGRQISSTSPRDGSGNFSGVPVVDIQTGSLIDLSVAPTNRVFDGSLITGTSGTLDLRAPQTSDGMDVQIDPINGTVNVKPSSSIVIEGSHVFDLTSSGGAIASDVETNVQANGNLFVNSMTTGTLLQNNRALASLTTIEPGADIINSNGDLTLANTWDLSLVRFGANNNVAGDLTLRASGNLVIDFGASLTDGFIQNPNPTLAAYGIWSDVLSSGPSWSYRLVSGADFGAADFHQVLPINQANPLIPSARGALNASSGSVVLGMNTPLNSLTGDTATQIMSTANAGLGYYQTIRTGTGNIDIASGRDVQILNNVATIYTAGSDVSSSLGNGFYAPVLTDPSVTGNSNYNYPAIGGQIATAQYSQTGGNVTISARGDVSHYVTYDPNAGLPIVAYDINGNPLMADSSKELPTNWLYRRGFDDSGTYDTNPDNQVASTTWWIDFSNFFEGVGALGGGDVTLKAGGNINNVDAVVPTNAYLGQDAGGDPISPTHAVLTELGGGDLVVQAGNNIDGGVYYVERGQANIVAGGSLTTNATRNTVSVTAPSQDELSTTLYLGKGNINVATGGDLKLGPIVNAFLLPQDINNTVNDKSYFSTYAASDSVSATSLTGAVTLAEAFSSSTVPAPENNLFDFYSQQLSFGGLRDFASSAPWLGSIETNLTPFATVMELLPPTLKVTAYSSDIDVQGNLTLSPSPVGTVDLVAAGSVNAFQPISVDRLGVESWGASRINLSDADPSQIPGVLNPLSYPASGAQNSSLATTRTSLFNPINSLFNISGSTTGSFALLATQQNLHADLPIDPSDPTSALGPLHAADANPIHIYAASGDIDGLNLFSGKFSDIVAGSDIANIALYIQNTNPTDITLVEAGRDIVAYDKNSPLREETHLSGGIYLDETEDPTNTSNFHPDGSFQGAPNAGDIQIAGPGALEVLAGRNLTLGDGPSNGDGTGLGIVSIGNTVDPSLSFNGADIIGAAGLGGSVRNVSNLGTSGFGLDSSSNSNLVFSNAAGSGFTDEFLNPNLNSQNSGEPNRYLPDLAALLGITGASNSQVWNIFSGTPDSSLNAIQQGVQAKLTPESRDALATTIFYDVLRDAGRDHNSPTSPDAGTYNEGYRAIAALFPASNSYGGDISLTAREIKTSNVGNISLLAPGGSVDVGLNNSGTQAIDQGILTVSGGNISIFTDQNVAVGTSRIFTLHGGDIVIWSTNGNIAAGASSKTVQSAPPTRVLIDPASGNVQTDLAGLATGGGIGVLETVVGAPPGNVDLIAPNGVVDAGDAGIRSSGNINIAAATILNAGNIQAGGSTSGVASTPTPNIGATVAASSAAGSSQNAASEASRQQQSNQAPPQDLPSIISVEVIGYSLGDSESAENTSAVYPMVARDNSH